MQLSFALLLFPLALILSGCGTKGPLTLTPPASPAPKATTAKPAPTPSTTDDSSRAATGAKP
jgi:predicted small lipoprotein YifL